MSVVVDTNVLISALLSSRSAPRVILNLFLARKLTWLVNDLILAEYREVLNRKEFGFHSAQVEDLLQFIETYATHVPCVPERISLPDPTDLAFLLCARQGKANALVTGNKKHFPFSVSKGFRVELPSEFLAR